mmetsp:Transcript_77260/g.201101  ORF Transcript_77260/g.201101 Transcript_77260/m.201101 type:complete len:719 (+) Transcript_77260:39-2195(+)
MKLAVAPMLLAACLLGAWCVFGVGGVAVSGAASDHPVGKVIKLIERLQKQVVEEGKEEALANEKFVYWCKTSKDAVSGSIKAEETDATQLGSKIAAAKQQEEALWGEIEQLKEERDKLEAESMEAANKRKKTLALYKDTFGDLTATIKAMDDAIEGLKKAGKPSLLNVDSGDVTVLLPTPEVHRALAKLQASADDATPQSSNVAEFLEVVAGKPLKDGRGDQAKHVQPYNFKSGNVIELLGSLKTNFEDELVAANTAETDSINEYELAKQARDNMIDLNKAAADEKKDTLKSVQGDLVQFKSDLKSAADDLQSDGRKRRAIEKKCSARAREWEQRCMVRDEELKAMATAISILDKAGGVRTEAPTNPKPAVSFLQIVSPREKALDLLRTAAHATHSKAMERLVAELTVRPNSPFDQVNNMIQKMIFRLMDEQTQEDKQKQWCDQEISKTSKSAKNKKDKMLELSGKMDVATARVQKLTGDIEAADKMVSKLTASMKEAVEVRALGKKENAAALKDAQDAQAAIANAVAVLKEFYKKSGMIEKESWEFLQRDAAPEDLADPDKPMPEYQGNPKASDILTLLSETAAEFAKMEADTRAQESTDEENFQEDMSTSKIDKARHAKESEMKGIEKKNVVDKIAMLEKSRKNVQKELDITDQYMKDLSPACVEGSSSYDDRKKDRQKEADALREAQGILTDAYKEKEKSSGGFLEVHRHIGAAQ